MPALRLQYFSNILLSARGDVKSYCGQHCQSSGTSSASRLTSHICLQLAESSAAQLRVLSRVLSPSSTSWHKLTQVVPSTYLAIISHSLQQYSSTWDTVHRIHEYLLLLSKYCVHVVTPVVLVYSITTARLYLTCFRLSRSYPTVWLLF